MWFKKNHISYKHKFLVNFNSAQKRKIHKEYYYCSSIFLVFCYAYLELLNTFWKRGINFDHLFIVEAVLDITLYFRRVAASIETVYHWEELWP